MGPSCRVQVCTGIALPLPLPLLDDYRQHRHNLDVYIIVHFNIIPSA